MEKDMSSTIGFMLLSCRLNSILSSATSSNLRTTIECTTRLQTTKIIVKRPRCCDVQTCRRGQTRGRYHMNNYGDVAILTWKWHLFYFHPHSYQVQINLGGVHFGGLLMYTPDSYYLYIRTDGYIILGTHS